MQRKAPRRHPLNQSRLYAIYSRKKLAELFELDRLSLNELLSGADLYSDRIIKIDKNGKLKERRIREPRGKLRTIHSIVQKMLSRIEPPDFLFCPVKRRSYVGNAEQHIGAGEIGTLDIKEYFPSTPRRRVFWFFNNIMKCSPDVSSVLAEMLTVDGNLATGSAVSPILSFFAFYDMWNDINELVSVSSCRLTVYMDDITISGPRVTDFLMWQVKQKIHSRDLVYHKERRYPKGKGEVTGVILSGDKMLVPNRQHLKAFEARAALAQTDDPTTRAKLVGRLRGLKEQRRQVEQRNPNQG